MQAKLPLIREVQTDKFLTSTTCFALRKCGRRCGSWSSFWWTVWKDKNPSILPLLTRCWNRPRAKALDSGYDFGEYRERVNRYIMEHRNDTLAIHKLTQNIPLSQGDYIELEHIFTSELGSKEDYAGSFRIHPLVCWCVKWQSSTTKLPCRHFPSSSTMNH